MKRQASLCQSFPCTQIPQILVLLTVSLLDLDGMGARSTSTVDEQSNDIPYRSAQLDSQLAQLPVLTKWMSHVDSHVTAMNNSLGGTH